ncbi:MAG: DsbA family protein [Alphaproteobacteria bacterium]
MTLSTYKQQWLSMVGWLFFLLLVILFTSGDANAQQRLSKEAFAKLSAYEYLPLGNPNATITVYEFASLTCSHCADFHNKTMPKIKKKYITSGKIKWQMIDFPLDNVAFGTAVLTRCIANKKRYHALLDLLFKNQTTWTNSKNPKKSIFDIMARAGVDSKTATACLQNKKHLSAITATRKLGDTIGVRSTPSFFVMDSVVPNNEKALFKAIDKAIK